MGGGWRELDRRGESWVRRRDGGRRSGRVAEERVVKKRRIDLVFPMSTTQIWSDRGGGSPQLQFCRRSRHSPRLISLAVMLSRAHWVGTRLDRLTSTSLG